MLVLAGGNALGAYQAGAYETLHTRGVTIERIVGASIGAVNGALIAGNLAADRIARLEALWRPGPARGVVPVWFSGAETARRTAAVQWALTTGHDLAFIPRMASAWLGSSGGSSSLYDTALLARTLAEMVDFDLLNAGEIRYGATAVDLESGEDVLFDTAAQHVSVEHVRASGALLPAFPAVEIDGRVYVDGGMSANLPLDPILADTPDVATLCLAIDLMPLSSERPTGIGEAASRAQDLIFAAQSRRTLTRWASDYAHRAQAADAPLAAITLVHMAYRAQGSEVAGKAFDYSPATTRERWAQGAADMAAVLDRIDRGEIALDRPGLTIERIG